ncbi:hypothetical protein HDU77_003666 [Chytriomyces hyalinus]|nr:hypothetical protein HDU77_003666 [Chytriomyces hyalinus]
MDKSLDELITESRRSRARGGTADGVGFMSARKERERGGRRERRRTPYEHNDNRKTGDGSDLRKAIGKGRGGKQGEWVGYPLALENLHFNVMPKDITAFISQTDDKVTVAIDYDEAGRSLGTAKIYFSTSEAAANGQKALHGMSLLGSIVSAEIVPVQDRVMHDVDNAMTDSNSDAYGSNDNGEYAYKSILDRMGRNRPSAYAAGNGSVLDRLGSRVLDRLGPTVIYNQSTRSQDGRHRQNGGSRGERSSNSGRGRARPVNPEDLDKEMDSYMSGDGNPVVLEDEVDNGSWKSDRGGNYNSEGRGDVRKEFVDFDAPSNDPYTTVGGGSGGGRGLLDYGDL